MKPINKDTATKMPLRCKKRSGLAENFGMKQQPVESISRRNERERNRVRFINKSFTVLKNCLPDATKRKKMSKVETLRQAMDYIHDLRDLLTDLDEDSFRRQNLSGFMQHAMQIQPQNTLNLYQGQQLVPTNGCTQNQSTTQFINLADLQRNLGSNGFTTLSNITTMATKQQVTTHAQSGSFVFIQAPTHQLTMNANENYIQQTMNNSSYYENQNKPKIISSSGSIDSAMSSASPGSQSSASPGSQSSASLDNSFDDVIDSEDSDLLDISGWFE